MHGEKQARCEWESQERFGYEMALIIIHSAKPSRRMQPNGVGEAAWEGVDGRWGGGCVCGGYCAGQPEQMEVDLGHMRKRNNNNRKEGRPGIRKEEERIVAL